MLARWVLAKFKPELGGEISFHAGLWQHLKINFGDLWIDFCGIIPMKQVRNSNSDAQNNYFAKAFLLHSALLYY